jgi:hypothetical protein
LKSTKSLKNFRYTVKNVGEYPGFFIVGAQKAVDNNVRFSPQNLDYVLYYTEYDSSRNEKYAKISVQKLICSLRIMTF